MGLGTTRAVSLGVILTLIANLSLTPASVHAAGHGRVRLVQHAMTDDGGPFLALGATLFWALWAERHDATHLDENLAWLSERGVDYVRILAMVGGTSWEDREIDPAEGHYWNTVDAFLTRLERHGMRAQVTLFAEADSMMPDRGERMTFADAWAEVANRRSDRLVFLEVANEHWKNGIGIDELRTLGQRLVDRTETLVALSAPAPGALCDVYENSAADLATYHYARSRSPWVSVRQPWEWPGADECRHPLPVAVNNEPIGPESSLESEEAPARLAMAFVTTFLAGNAAYVLHAGAGVRGGGAADRQLGRSPTFAETPNLDEALRAIARHRDALPSDLPNWIRRSARDREYPFDRVEGALADKSLAAAYAVTESERFVVTMLDLRRPVPIRARRAMHLEIRNALGELVDARALEAGASVTLRGSEAFVLIGR